MNAVGHYAGEQNEETPINGRRRRRRISNSSGGKCSEWGNDRCRLGGAVGGAIVGGPVGAVVGGVGGAIIGGISDDRRAGFRTYVVQEKRSSYKYDRDVVIGAELPSAGVTYYEVPAEYGVKDYRYTVVNNRTVLVDPRTHRIVQVIE
jgi:hypothetical protein